MERRLYSILGNAQKLDGGAMFGNAPKAMWEKWMPADALNRINLVTRALLVREPHRNILFEAGIGAFFPPHLKERYGVTESRHVLLDSLQAANISPDDIDVVVLSHLHFDHAGGLLTPWAESEAPRLVFDRATYVVGDTAWDRAQNPHPRDRASFIPELVPLLQATGRLELASGTSSRVLGPGYTFHVSNGHTPGMLLTEIPGNSGPVLFCADLIPGRPWVRRALTMGYDRYPELLIDEKTRILEDITARNGRLFYTHDPNCALSGLQHNEKGQIISTEARPELQNFLA